MAVTIWQCPKCGSASTDARIGLDSSENARVVSRVCQGPASTCALIARLKGRS